MTSFAVEFGLFLIVSSAPLLPADLPSAARIEGNRAFHESELSDYLKSRQIDFSLLAVAPEADRQRARRLLEQFYQDRGFPLARVDLETEKALRFRIVEGPRAELGNIRFLGNSRFAEKTLVQFFEAEPRLDFDRIEADLEKVRDLYRDWGFARVQVGPPRVEVVERARPDHFPLPLRRRTAHQADLTVSIQEGPEFHFNRISVPASFPVEEVALPAPGDLYRHSDLDQLRKRILNFHFEKGQLLEGLQVLEDFQDSAATVDLLVVYRVLPELTIRRLEFRGHRRYPDSFYRRELSLQEEKALDPRLLQTSLQALARTGVLQSVSAEDVEIAVDHQFLTADVTIDLHEKDRHGILFGFGPDGLGGVDASVFYSVANLLGLGETLGLDLRVGSHTSEIAAGVASRYLLGTSLPASLALRVFRRHSTFSLPGVENLVREFFTSDAEGITVGTNYRIRDHQNLLLEGGWERTRNPFQARHFTLAPAWQWILPENDGSFTGLRIGQRGSFFDSSSDVFSTTTEVTLEHTFDRSNLEKTGAGFRLHLAHAYFAGGTEPLYERILKGPDELRGFSSTAGPWAEAGERLIPVGGDTLASLSSEYQIPLPRSFSLVPYLDTGINLAASPTGATRWLVPETNRIWRASTGFELRLRPLQALPITRLMFSWNPLRLDRAFSHRGELVHLRDPLFSFRVSFF